MLEEDRLRTCQAQMGKNRDNNFNHPIGIKLVTFSKVLPRRSHSRKDHHDCKGLDT